jgi:hypothetical protein
LPASTRVLAVMVDRGDGDGVHGGRPGARACGSRPVASMKVRKRATDGKRRSGMWAAPCP